MMIPCVDNITRRTKRTQAIACCNHNTYYSDVGEDVLGPAHHGATPPDIMHARENVGTPGGTNSSVGGTNSSTNGIKRKYPPY